MTKENYNTLVKYISNNNLTEDLLNLGRKYERQDILSKCFVYYIDMKIKYGADIVEAKADAFDMLMKLLQEEDK